MFEKKEDLYEKIILTFSNVKKWKCGTDYSKFVKNVGAKYQSDNSASEICENLTFFHAHKKS